MLRGITIGLLVISIFLGCKFWFSNDSVLHVMKLKKSISLQQKENAALRLRNDAVIDRIATLKHSPRAIEEQARYELGMIKRGEKFYQIVEPID